MRGVTYESGIMKDAYGVYDGRVPEYRFATMTAFNLGVFRKNTPVLDIGCRDPYEGLLRFLRSFGWSGDYVGIDHDVPQEAVAAARQDVGQTTYLLQRDLETALLPFPPTREMPIKQFACAFVIEVLEHIVNQEALINELKRVAATVFVIGPNAGFGGYYHHIPDHKRELSEEMFKEWGFQDIGFVNFNGRPSRPADLYDWQNGKRETCSEVWGFWRDDVAQRMQRSRTPREACISTKMTDSEMLQFQLLAQEAGYVVER